MQKRESAVIEFHDNALASLDRVRIISFQQEQIDRLILAEHFAGSDSKEQGISDLSGGAGYSYFYWFFHGL